MIHWNISIKNVYIPNAFFISLRFEKIFKITIYSNKFYYSRIVNTINMISTSLRIPARIFKIKHITNKYQKKTIITLSQTECVKSYEDIPGPKMYPIIGNLLDTKDLGKKQLENKYKKCLVNF